MFTLPVCYTLAACYLVIIWYQFLSYDGFRIFSLSSNDADIWLWFDVTAMGGLGVWDSNVKFLGFIFHIHFSMCIAVLCWESLYRDTWYTKSFKSFFAHTLSSPFSLQMHQRNMFMNRVVFIFVENIQRYDPIGK